jgi:Leucine Rich repeat
MLLHARTTNRRYEQSSEPRRRAKLQSVHCDRPAEWPVTVRSALSRARLDVSGTRLARARDATRNTQERLELCAALDRVLHLRELRACELSWASATVLTSPLRTHLTRIQHLALDLGRHRLARARLQLADSIALALHNQTCLTHLSLAHHPFRSIGTSRLGLAIAALPRLQRLVFTGGAISSSRNLQRCANAYLLHSLFEARLAGGVTALTHLALGQDPQWLNHAFMRAHTGAQLAALRTLRSLALVNAGIGNKGARALAPGLNELPALEMLNLTDNNIGSAHAVEALAWLPTRPLVLLHGNVLHRREARSVVGRVQLGTQRRVGRKSRLRVLRECLAPTVFFGGALAASLHKPEQTVVMMAASLLSAWLGWFLEPVE